MKYVLSLWMAMILFLAVKGQEIQQYQSDCNKNNREFGSLYSQGKYEAAIEKTKEASTNCLKGYGDKSRGYAGSLHNRALVHATIGQYEEAIKLYNQAKDIQKEALGEHYDYLISLKHLADVYWELEEYSKIIPLCEESEKIIKEAYGEYNEKYTLNLYNLAKAYERMGNFQKAIPLYLKTLDITKRTDGEFSESYATTLHSLAFSYKCIGEYQTALPLYLKAKDIREVVVGKEHSSYAISLDNLANLYQVMSNFDKSLACHNEAIEIRKNLSPKGYHKDYASSLDHLAELHQGMGEHQKALPLYIKAKDIRGKTLGKDHSDYAISIYNLAKTYHVLNDTKKALPLYEEAGERFKKILGENHPNYGTVLGSISHIYVDLREFEKALPLAIENKNIAEKTIGKEHPDYAILIDKIAMLYLHMDQYDKAFPLLTEAKNIRKRIFGKKHPSYAFSLTNLRKVNRLAGFHKNALELSEEILDIYRPTLGEQHPYYLSELEVAAKINYELGNQEKGVELLAQALNHRLKNIQKYTSILSEQTTIKHLQHRSITQYYAHHLLSLHPSPELLTASHNYHLQTKALGLQGSTDTRLAALTEGNEDLKNKLRTYQALRTQNYIAQMTSAAEREKKGIDLRDLERQIEEMESQLALESDYLKQQFEHRKQAINHKELTTVLESGEATLDFVSYQHYDGKEWVDSIIYAAYLTRPEFEYPLFIPLGSGQDIHVLIEEPIDENAMSYIQNHETNKELYQLVFAPLEKHLKGVQTLRISPFGVLNNVAFHALRTNDDQLLVDKYSIHYHSTFREFILDAKDPQPDNDAPKAIALFGHPDFDANIEKVNEQAPSDRTSSWNLRSHRDGFSSLPETGKEIENIVQTANKYHIVSSAVKGMFANEQSFKSLSGNRVGIIHTATHGYALPRKEAKTGNPSLQNKDRIQQQENALLRAGLALAGGNTTWKSEMPPLSGNDGLLSAYEIASMDLSKTKLVVLSACNTGRGDILSGEGVFGLQRAFRMAGAKQLIVSLWEVDDAATRLLMEKFYTHYFDGKFPYDALKLAQKEMREGKYSEPEYWAGFILVE